MDKYAHIAIVLIIISFVMTTAVFGVIFLAVRGLPSTQPAPADSDCTLEQSRIIAESYIKESSTFKFDGVDGSVRLLKTEALGSKSGWLFEYTFQTRHPGHGDRTRQMLAQVITDHIVLIEMRECEVISATCDNIWDLKQNKPLQ